MWGGGICWGLLSSHPHCLFSSVCRSGSSSDNHYYSVPHHGHSCADNNSCLKKLVRSLLLCLAWGWCGMGTGWGWRCPSHCRCQSSWHLARIVLESHCRRKWGVYTKTSKQSWLVRVQLHPHSFPTSQHLASGFGDQHIAGVGWTSLMGHVCIAAPGLSASARCHLERSEPCVGPQRVFPGSAQCQQRLLRHLP